MMGPSREASHAGSWYSSDEGHLSLQLDRWLDQVPASAQPIGPSSSSGPPVNIPTAKARVIISPHAGYSYSGQAAAWAYKALDLSQAKRVFILGPSHHFYLTNCALSQCSTYETPLGQLTLDEATIAELQTTGLFDRMSQSVDEDEHSIEMQLPYLHKILSRTFSDYISNLPPIIPILVGNTSPETEKRYGALLAPYLADPTSAFIISSDFCHWGSRFRYTYYEDKNGIARNLKSNDKSPTAPRICDSIGDVDLRCMGAVESGQHTKFTEVLQVTGNTVCGRHPISIIMAALEVLKSQASSDAEVDLGLFKFVRYERSSDCVSVKDSSVSYASAFAAL